MGLFGNKTTTGPQRTVALIKDPTGAPAVDINKVRETNPDVAKHADKAGFELSKRGLSGIRIQVKVLLDFSGSMRSDYRSGAVQELLQRILGFSLQVDADGTVPVIPFDDQVRRAFDVDLDTFATAIGDNLGDKFDDMGSTNLAGALERVLTEAKGTDEAIFLVVLTDGSPDNRKAATKVVCELAGYPVFIKFMALRPVDYLTELDDLGGDVRLVDNVDAKPEKGSPLALLACSDAEFQAAMIDEVDTWITAATAAGILKS